MFLLYCIIQSFKPDWTTFETIWKLQEFNANRMTTSILVITKFGTCIQTKLHDPHDSCTGNTAASYPFQSTTSSKPKTDQKDFYVYVSSTTF